MIEFRTREAERFFQLWQAMPREGLVPRKSALVHRDFASLMGSLVIVKLESRDMFRLTLVGTHHTDAAGEELTGRNYLDQVPEERRALAIERMWNVIAHPVGNHFIYRAVAADGRRAIMESTQLPLAEDDGTPRYLFAFASELEREDYQNPPPGRPITTTILSHSYMDIGAGVPAEATEPVN